MKHRIISDSSWAHSSGRVEQAERLTISTSRWKMAKGRGARYCARFQGRNT